MDTMLHDGGDFGSIDQDEEIARDWEQRYDAGEEILRGNLRKFGLLDDRVKTIKGYFNETLKGNEHIQKLSLIR